jgi:hypothetical protein
MLQVDPRINSAPIAPVTSVREFASRYSVNVDQGIIQIVDRATDLVLATLTTPPEEKQRKYYPSHFYEGVYYFVLNSKCSTAKHVYGFNLQNRAIEYLFAPSHHPHFFESRFIEFGTGFNIPGPQVNDPFFKTGQGIIKVYDLTQRPFREVNHITVQGGGGCGWDGEIDTETKEITAFCHVKGITRRFPIFEKV